MITEKASKGPEQQPTFELAPRARDAASHDWQPSFVAPPPGSKADLLPNPSVPESLRGVLVISDVDGTIIGDDGFPDKGVKAIKDFQEKGGVYAIATARPPKLIPPLREKLAGVDVVYSCGNGALLFEYQDGVPHITKLVHFDRADIPGIYLAAEESLAGLCAEANKNRPAETDPITVGFALECAKLGKYEKNPNEALKTAGYVHPDDYAQVECSGVAAMLAKMGDHDAFKLQVSLPGVSAKLIREALRDFYPGVSVTSSFPDGMVELSWGTSKRDGLNNIAELKGLTTRYSLAFGDDANDADMLQGARVGFGMRNGNPDLLGAMLVDSEGELIRDIEGNPTPVIAMSTVGTVNDGAQFDIIRAFIDGTLLFDADPNARALVSVRIAEQPLRRSKPMAMPGSHM